MTIKNTKKNISAENESIVTDIQNTDATKTNNTSNFNSSQTITITTENFYDEDDRQTVTEEIEIPLGELVRLGYLQDQYYDKDYIDRRVKTNIEVLSSRPYPDDSNWSKKWAQDVRTAEKENYIFFVSFPAASNNETYTDGGYEEYYYKVDTVNGSVDLNTERMEKVGSFSIDLSNYLLEENFNSTLISDQSFINLGNDVATNTSNITTLSNSKLDKVLPNHPNSFLVTNASSQITTTSKIGNINVNGALTDINNNALLNQILITGSNNSTITGTDTLPTSVIKNSAALTRIGTAKNALQSTINENIDGKFTDIYNIELPKYLLLSQIKNEVWGSSGFRTLQDGEANNSATKNLKLGDYIYAHVYDKFVQKTQLARVGSTNLYDDLDNKPTIPTKLSDLVDDITPNGGNGDSLTIVDIVRDDNPNAVTSNAVYDHTKDILEELETDLEDPSAYIVQDEEEPALTVSLLELIDTLTQRIGDG